MGVSILPQFHQTIPCTLTSELTVELNNPHNTAAKKHRGGSSRGWKSIAPPAQQLSYRDR